MAIWNGSRYLSENFVSGPGIGNTDSAVGNIGVSTNRITGINTSGIVVGQQVSGNFVSAGTTVTFIGITTVGIGTTTTNTTSQSNVTFTFSSMVALTSAVVGIGSTVNFQIQSTSAYTISVTNGTISLKNYSVGVSTAVPGYLTGRRPQTGQLFPRGIYNK